MIKRWLTKWLESKRAKKIAKRMDRIDQDCKWVEEF